MIAMRNRCAILLLANNTDADDTAELEEELRIRLGPACPELVEG